jgi:hypothetical protein
MKNKNVPKNKLNIGNGDKNFVPADIDDFWNDCIDGSKVSSNSAKNLKEDGEYITCKFIKYIICS